MMDGLYEFRMLGPTVARFGVLLKQGALLLGRAGDRIVIGIIGLDHIGAAAELMIWEHEPTAEQPIDGHAAARIRFRGLMSRGSARLVAEADGCGMGLRVDLNLFRTPTSRTVVG